MSRPATHTSTSYPVPPHSYMLISNDTRGATYSPEIISEIIGYFYDMKTLLTLSLVSKQTLYESRRLLFSTVDFFGPDENSDTWEDFDRFLRLVDVAWTSFTPTIQCISIQKAYDSPAIDDSAGRAARIRMNLPNVKSLCFSSLKWTRVPSYILDLVFQLPIEYLSLDSVQRCNVTNLLNLFKRFPPSLRTLDFTRMDSTTRPDLSKKPSIFQLPFRFEALDSHSLLLFESVWDPSICHDLDIQVESFCFRPVHDQFWWYMHASPFIFRFLQHIGPSLENLTISLADHFSQYKGIRNLWDPIHVSPFINLRSLDIEGITLGDHAPDSATLIEVVQKFLSALPSPGALREISITFELVAPSQKRRLAELKWSSLVGTVQRLFPRINELVIQICIRSKKKSETEDPNPYLDLLRRVANVRDLEKEGVLRLDVSSEFY